MELALSPTLVETRRTTRDCPRCGYDLSGAIAAWERLDPPQCPLEGQCSECGLELAWVDVLRPDREHLRGFYEHAVSARQRATWPFRTLLLALAPWLFWSRVRLVMKPVVRRALAWPIIMILLPWAFSSVINSCAMWMAISSRVSAVSWTQYQWATVLNGWTWPLAVTQYGSWRPLAPASFGVSPTEFGYLLVGVLAAAVAWPLAMLILGDTMRSARMRKTHLLRAAAYSLALLGALCWLRVLFALGAFGVTLVTIWSRGGSMPYPFVIPNWLAGVGPQLAFLLMMLLWLALWWHHAIRRGFRLKHAASVWALLLILTLLAALVAISYSGPWLNWQLMKLVV